MCARPTPARTARAHASTFGIIPPLAAPDTTMASSSSAVICLMSVDGSSGTDRIPETSVRKTIFSAWRAAANAPAAESALMLKACPV